MSKASRRPLRKRLLASPAFMWPWVILAYGILRLIYLTNRKVMHRAPELEPYAAGDKPAVYCFWHGRMLAQLFIDPPGRTMYVFSTKHADGVIAAMFCRCFGIRTVWGTRSKGAAAAASAARALLNVAQQGYNIGITPDGPRGPFQKAAPGAAYIASKSGHPLIPVAFSASRAKRFRSWDRFMLFYPFGRIHYVVGTPIFVPADADDAMIARTTAQLEEHMIRITHEADALAGVTG